ncbi:BnaC08g02350D [Brassica napus]|uniref:BnaC08g02350D protein n=1 Tax=Brassica napus TaxID=3708 RepID=A0A078H7I0_BRANA|nr:BnaC08g02350D [Brassica napus]
MGKLCRGWNFTSNHLADDDGRIIVFWKDNISVRVLHQTRQALTCEVKIPDSSTFVYTAIYASNESSERIDLWVELLNTYQNFSLDAHLGCQILNLFPDCSAFFLPSLTSDHSPCLLNLAYKIPSFGTRPFKFYNYLSKHPWFHQLVLEAWTQAGGTTWNLTALS